MLNRWQKKKIKALPLKTRRWQRPLASSPCVRSKRPRVCWHQMYKPCGRVACIHGDLLNVHTVTCWIYTKFFSMPHTTHTHTPHTTHHTTPHHTTTHTHTTTPHTHNSAPQQPPPPQQHTETETERDREWQRKRERLNCHSRKNELRRPFSLHRRVIGEDCMEGRIWLGCQFSLPRWVWTGNA